MLNSYLLIDTLIIIDMIKVWGHSSAGKASAWHAGGQRFESAWLIEYIGFKKCLGLFL